MAGQYTKEEETIILKSHDKDIPLEAVSMILGRPISGVYQKLRTLLALRNAKELDLDRIRKELGIKDI